MLMNHDADFFSVRLQRRQIQTLEAQSAQVTRGSNAIQQGILDALAADKKLLLQDNKKLKDDIAVLKDELEELRAMIEVLKDRRGLVSEPRASPLLYAWSVVSIIIYVALHVFGTWFLGNQPIKIR